MTTRLPRSLFLALSYALLLLPSAVQADCEIEVLKRLKANYPAWRPQGVIDVGANVGCWTIYSHRVYNSSKFLMLEAYDDFEVHLKKLTKNPNLGYHMGVLSEDDGKKVEFYQRGDTGNSMFQQGGVYAHTKPIEKTTVKLDTVKQKSFLKNDRVDYIKLDVQGAELVVLKGATELLKEASFVQFEASVVEYNRGGSCLHEIDDFLRGQGYFMYDFGDPIRNDVKHFKTKATGQMDILYIRPSSPHLPRHLLQTKPNFCGSDRKHFVGQQLTPINNGLAAATWVAQGIQSGSLAATMASFGIPLSVGLIAGYICGVARSRQTRIHDP